MDPQQQTWAGITMIVVGASIAIGGFILLLAAERRPMPMLVESPPTPKIGPVVVAPPRPEFPPPRATHRPAESTPKAPPTAAEAPPSAVEKGRMFEDWVVKRFRRDLFSIKEWRGDKYVDGIYAESSKYPDLEVEFQLRDVRERFAVECKWRARWDAGEKPFLTWAEERQIAIYQEFAQNGKIPVFVAIGLGGRPDDPAEVFLVPLDRLRFPKATEEYLDRFRRKKPVDRNFYFDSGSRELR